jgi:hypothetical protein
LDVRSDSECDADRPKKGAVPDPNKVKSILRRAIHETLTKIADLPERGGRSGLARQFEAEETRAIERERERP